MSSATLRFSLPFLLAACTTIGASDRADDPEAFWEARAVTLSSDRDLTLVPVAIWDTGVDPTLFRGLLHRNEAEVRNGRDDDGNGFIDDLHGIAFDRDGVRNGELLRAMDDSPVEFALLERHREGAYDWLRGQDTPAAHAFDALEEAEHPDRRERLPPAGRESRTHC